MEGRKLAVILCSCGGQITKKVDFSQLKSLAEELPGVVEVIETQDFC